MPLQHPWQCFTRPTAAGLQAGWALRPQPSSAVDLAIAWHIAFFRKKMVRGKAKCQRNAKLVKRL